MMTKSSLKSLKHLVRVENLYENIPDDLSEELFQDIVANNCFRLERIVSRGHASPPGFWYQQEEDEWVVLLSGEAVLLFEHTGRKVRMAAGDSMLIPAGVRHRVEWTDPSRPDIWLALHFSPGCAGKRGHEE